MSGDTLRLPPPLTLLFIFLVLFCASGLHIHITHLILIKSVFVSWWIQFGHISNISILTVKMKWAIKFCNWNTFMCVFTCNCAWCHFLQDAWCYYYSCIITHACMTVYGPFSRCLCVMRNYYGFTLNFMGAVSICSCTRLHKHMRTHHTMISLKYGYLLNWPAVCDNTWLYKIMSRQ